MADLAEELFVSNIPTPENYVYSWEYPSLKTGLKVLLKKSEFRYLKRNLSRKDRENVQSYFMNSQLQYSYNDARPYLKDNGTRMQVYSIKPTF